MSKFQTCMIIIKVDIRFFPVLFNTKLDISFIQSFNTEIAGTCNR